MSFFGLGKMLRYVFYCDERPGEVIYSADHLEPIFLGGKTCSGMEVNNDRFGARKFVDAVDGITWPIGHHDDLDMIKDVVGC